MEGSGIDKAADGKIAGIVELQIHSKLSGL